MHTAAIGRRSFLLGIGGLALAAAPLDLERLERARVLGAANRYLKEQPITITASRSPRSAGGPHDYFSEGDYWWPDPENPRGPYIRRDGLTNPGNFTAHRAALIRFSLQVPALAAAWRLTRDDRYAHHAARHVRAWFLDPSTRMSPHLRYAQAISGRATGRGTGIIDTIHLVEVVRAIESIEPARVLSGPEREGVRAWFAKYLEWLTTHAYGLEEREARNNHGTCWVMQASAFARYVGRDDVVSCCRRRFKEVLVPVQMSPDGSFPLELARTKPYGYSLFNIDAMSVACELLSTRDENLWTWQLADGRGMRRALDFIAPFIADKGRWPHNPDVMHFEGWPIRHISLLLGGLALGRADYAALWRRLEADPQDDEIVRNYIGRQPLLWVR